VQIEDGELQVQQSEALKPDVVFQTDKLSHLGLFSGQIKLDEAVSRRLIRNEGDPGALRKKTVPSSGLCILGFRDSGSGRSGISSASPAIACRRLPMTAPLISSTTWLTSATSIRPVCQPQDVE
jgi:hypothetical protein